MSEMLPSREAVGLKMAAWHGSALWKRPGPCYFGTAKVETDAGLRVFVVQFYLHELDLAATRVARRPADYKSTRAKLASFGLPDEGV
jgi:hypothetical protein